MARAPRFTVFACVVAALTARLGLANTAPHGWLRADDVIVEDFETEAFQVSPASAQTDSSHWQSTGVAFSSCWHAADGFHPQGVSMSRGYSWACGKKLVHSYAHPSTGIALGGQATGTLISPPFTIQKAYLSFLIGGACHPQAITVQLLHAGRVVRSATGAGHATLRMVAFDTRLLMGKTVQIRLVDRLRSVEGFLIVDRFVQTDRPATSDVIAGADPPLPGLVRTRSGVMKGELVLHGDRLTVGGRDVPLPALLSLNHGGVGSVSPATGIRLRSGELWAGALQGFANGSVQLGTVGGPREIKLSDIATLIFDATVPVAAGTPETLYRRHADPIPGKLVWIRGRDIAIDCVLGILPVPREQLARFVVQPVDAATDDGRIEVGLTDGSILHARTLTLRDGRILLQHSLLGELALGLSQITHLQRRAPDILWLAKPSRTRTQGLVGPGVDPAQREAGVAGGQVFRQTMRLHAQSKAIYDLPPAMQQGAILRGTLVPLLNARANVRVAVEVSGTPVWQAPLKPGSTPVEVNLRLSACKDVSLAVAYDGKAAVPGGVDWLDAHLLSAAAVAK